MFMLCNPPKNSTPTPNPSELHGVPSVRDAMRKHRRQQRGRRFAVFNRNILLRQPAEQAIVYNGRC